MKNVNMRKIKYVVYIVALTGGMALGFQNFTPKLEKINLGEKSQGITQDAFAAALSAAETDHLNKQIALNVEPDQIEKARKKDRKPQSIIVPSDMITEDADSTDSLQGAKSFQKDDGSF